MASTPKLATTLDAPQLPPVPSSAVPITDPAWVDFFTKLQRYVAAQTAFMEPVAAAVATLQGGASSNTSSGS
jgi:hypothetical protein